MDIFYIDNIFSNINESEVAPEVTKCDLYDNYMKKVCFNFEFNNKEEILYIHKRYFNREFPIFESQEDGSFINDMPQELNILSQDMYLPPFDDNKAYYDLSGNFPGDFTTYNLRFLEGYDTPCTGNLLDEIDLDTISTKLIFLESFEKELESAVFPDISLQDIFMDQQIMNVKDTGKDNTYFPDAMCNEKENNVINLYYMNEKPSKESRKLKASNYEKEKHYGKKRRTM